MKKFLTVALLAGGLLVTTATAASAHTSVVTHVEDCPDEGGATTTVVTFDNNHGLIATVHYQWDSEPADTVNIPAKTGDSNPKVSLDEHAVGTLKYHVTWATSDVRQPTTGDATLEIDPLPNCPVATTTTSSSTTSTSTSSTTSSTTTTTLGELNLTTVAPAATEQAVVKAEVRGVTLTAPVAAPAPGPAPVGGVQTGGGGTSQSTNHLLPLGVALALVGFAGLVTMQLRRRVG